MTQDELKNRAVQIIDRALKKDAPERRIVHRSQDAAFFADVQRSISDHKLAVLTRGGDFIVYFDAQGKIAGWRDEGRQGVQTRTPPPSPVGPLRDAIVGELELPSSAVLGTVRAAALPLAGWTWEVIVFPRPDCQASDVLKVWVDPEDMRVIQVLTRDAAEARI